MSHQVLDEEIDGITRIGGLSGLAYNPSINKFVAVADKPPARLIQFRLDSITHKFVNPELVLLQPNDISKSELEGIVYDGQGYLLSDEQQNGTRIFRTDIMGNFLSIILPKNRPFLPLSGHNSGIEGLSLGNDKTSLFFAFERPSGTCLGQQITTIGKIDLQSNETELYAYKLHNVENDALNTNGISEILTLSDTTLIVMERAYIPGQGNIVRLFEVSLSDPVSNIATALDCSAEYKLVRSKLVYDFADNQKIKIDNAEGMCFNGDHSELLIITDNNFSKKQETQVIRMKLSKK